MAEIKIKAEISSIILPPNHYDIYERQGWGDRSVKCLPHKHENLSSIPSKNPNLVEHAYNLSAGN